VPLATTPWDGTAQRAVPPAPPAGRRPGHDRARLPCHHPGRGPRRADRRPAPVCVPAHSRADAARPPRV